MVKGQLQIKVSIAEKSRKNKREKTKQMKWMSKQFVCEHSIRNVGFYGWSWAALKRTNGDDLLDLIESKEYTRRNKFDCLRIVSCDIFKLSLQQKIMILVCFTLNCDSKFVLWIVLVHQDYVICMVAGEYISEYTFSF